MNPLTYLLFLFFLATIVAGGKRRFVPGGTILDIDGPHHARSVGGPRGVRGLLGRRREW